MKVKPLLLAALLAIASCKSAAHRPSVGLMATPPPNGRVIGFDPSVVGLPGAISDTVYDSAGIISWVKFGPLNTDWRPVPVSQFVTGDPSQAPGLKAPIGFVVTKTDGTASWTKSTSSDTGWVANPGGGGGGGGLVADGGVLPPLKCTTDAGTCGTVANPLTVAAATESLPGSMSASDKTTIDQVTTDWGLRAAKFMQSQNGSLAACRYRIVPPINTTNTAPTSGDGAKEGGSTTTLLGGVIYFIGPSLFQAPFTGNWAITFHAYTLGGGASGHDSEMGMINAAQSHLVAVMRRNATSTTKWTIQVVGGTTDRATGTAAADSNFHSFTLGGNGSAFYTGIDFATDVTGFSENAIIDEPYYPFLFSATVAEVTVVEYEYCTVQ